MPEILIEGPNSLSQWDASPAVAWFSVPLTLQATHTGNHQVPMITRQIPFVVSNQAICWANNKGADEINDQGVRRGINYFG